MSATVTTPAHGVYCTACGTRCTLGAKYCPACGKPIADPASLRSRTARPSSVLIGLAIGAALLLVIFAAGIYDSTIPNTPWHAQITRAQFDRVPPGTPLATALRILGQPRVSYAVTSGVNWFCDQYDMAPEGAAGQFCYDATTDILIKREYYPPDRYP